MTVIVGAICEKEPAAVIAADRLITLRSDTMSLGFDGVGAKIRELSDQVAVGIAAPVAPLGEQVVQNVLAENGSLANLSVARAAEKVQRAFEEVRAKEVEDCFIRPSLNVDFGQFRQIVAANSTSILADMLKQVREYRTNTEFLVAGVDTQGAHLYIINEQHATKCHDHEGFSTIGRAAAQVVFSLTQRPNLKACDLALVVYAVFEAKKTAQLSLGIGNTTDLVILRRAKPPRRLTPAELEKLEQVYGKMRPAELPSNLRRTVESIYRDD